jgi:hypothetical protein
MCGHATRKGEMRDVIQILDEKSEEREREISRKM